MLVVRVLVFLERASITTKRFLKVAMDVGDDTKILLRARAQFAACASERECTTERFRSVRQRAFSDSKDAKRIQRLRGEQRILVADSDLVAAVTQPQRIVTLVALMADDGKSTERLSKDGKLPMLFGTRDCLLILADGLRNATGPLLLTSG